MDDNTFILLISEKLMELLLMATMQDHLSKRKDLCSLSGFRDYNVFFKSFVNAVGISSKRYTQTTTVI